MIYKFRTLLLRNYQAFLFISNNQTLLDTHDYQANICTRFPLESWVKKIQCKGTTQFLFRDKWSFVHNPFLMVTTTNLLYSSLWQLSFWRKQTFHFSNVLSVQPFSSYTFYLQNSKIWLVSGTEFAKHIVIKLVFCFDFSKKFQLVVLTETEQHCSEITHLLFIEKLLLIITIYIIWDAFVYFSYILLKHFMLFDNLISVFICLLLHHGKSPIKCIHDNCLLIFLDRS